MPCSPQAYPAQHPVAVEAWRPAVLQVSSLHAGPWPLPLGTVNDINHKTLVNNKTLGEPTSLHQPTGGVNTNRPGGAHEGVTLVPSCHLTCPRLTGVFQELRQQGGRKTRPVLQRGPPSPLPS